ncbi:MAG: hypothetical protein ACLGGX_01355 [Bdellovibrionia bacterium]
MKLLISLLSVLILLPLTALADDFELTRTYRSTRALGMGSAYSAVVMGGDSLYYNPSALAYNEGINIEIANVNFGVNGLDVYEDIQGLPANPTLSDYDSLFGTNIWLGSNGRATITLPYFGFGLAQDAVIKFYARDPGLPTVETYFKNDTITSIAFASTLGPESTVGLNFKRIHRVGGYTSQLDPLTLGDVDAVSNIQSNFANAGVGYGIDLAFSHKVKAPFNPTVALVWEDVGSTAFTKSAGTDAPPLIRDNITLGLGASVDLPGIDWLIALDYTHANQNGIDLGKKIHIGQELSLPFIDLRAGYSQGYLSYGAGFNFFLFRFDTAFYTEELGVYPGQNPDNRIQIGLTLDLSFDANFKLTDNNGRKRKLKQRR